MADRDKENPEVGFIRILSLGMQMPMRKYYICPKESSFDGKKKSCGCMKKGWQSKKVNNSNRKPFTNCIYYRSNIREGCYILTERLCETKGKCSFFKRKV